MLETESQKTFFSRTQKESQLYKISKANFYEFCIKPEESVCNIENYLLSINTSLSGSQGDMNKGHNWVIDCVFEEKH